MTDIADRAHQRPVTVRLQQPVGEAVVNLDEIHRVVKQRIERAKAGAEVIDGDTNAFGPELVQQGQRLAVASHQIALLELEDKQLG